MIRNIVLIVIDCLRADHVAAYGYPRPTTPTIDALAKKGVLWENAHSLSSWTRPSVTSLLTGLYPSQHGVFQGIKRSKNRSEVTTDILQTTTPTLAEEFTQAGWRCGAFINNAQLGPYTRLDRGFAAYEATAGKADRILESFADWFAADSKTPSFAYLHFLEAHYPYKPRRRHVAMFGGDRDKNHFRDYSARDYGKLRRAVSRSEETLGEDRLNEMIQMYDGAVRRLDGKVKKLLGMLTETGVADQTMVVVTADHGEEFLDQGRIGHGHALSPSLTHVPLVALIPGAQPPQRRSEPVTHVDLAATLLHAAGIEPNLLGENLLAPGGPRSPVCCELQIRRRYSHCLRTADWSLHREYKFEAPDDRLNPSWTPTQWIDNYAHTVTTELYSTKADPAELTNLADVSLHEDVLHAMTATLDNWSRHRAVSVRDHTCSTEIDLDPRVLERLQDLGYIE